MILGAFLAEGAAITVAAVLRLWHLSALLAAHEHELRATRLSKATEQMLYQLVNENASDVIVPLNRQCRRLLRLALLPQRDRLHAGGAVEQLRLRDWCKPVNDVHRHHVGDERRPRPALTALRLASPAGGGRAE